MSNPFYDLVTLEYDGFRSKSFIKTFQKLHSRALLKTNVIVIYNKGEMFIFEGEKSVIYITEEKVELKN